MTPLPILTRLLFPYFASVRVYVIQIQHTDYTKKKSSNALDVNIIGHSPFFTWSTNDDAYSATSS